jgi:hypothetical protein
MINSESFTTLKMLNVSSIHNLIKVQFLIQLILYSFQHASVLAYKASLFLLNVSVQGTDWL